jgi:AAA+ superfamily predicted ATPase
MNTTDEVASLPDREDQAVPLTVPEMQELPSSEMELLLVRFRLRARRRAAWLQTLWNEEGVSGGGQVISHAELAAILSDRDSPENEAIWAAEHPHVQIWNEQLRRVETALRNFPGSRLAQLAETFGLTLVDRDLLEACAAVALDPTLARVCAYLHDTAEMAGVSEALTARLYGHGRCSVWPAESALFRWELVVPRESAGPHVRLFFIDPQIRDWLLGRAVLSEPLVGIARLLPVQPSLESWPVNATATAIQNSFKTGGPVRLHVAVTGPRGSGKKHFAAAVANQLGLPLLVLSPDAVEENSRRRVFLHAQRHAFLERCALCWPGDAASRLSTGRNVVEFPLQFFTSPSVGENTASSGAVELRIVLPPLSIEERGRLWTSVLPAASQWSAEELNRLAERHRLTPGDIVQARRSAVQTTAEASEVVRRALRQRLGTLAQPLETPFDWDDLIVAPAVRTALEAIAFEAEHRARFWEQSAARRLFPQGRGLLALLSGPSGTGKTMAAQVIAARLGQDLFRINVAQIVSKWVGETAKHFDFLLSQAAEMDAVLFFDEADALFAKRSSDVRDAQDKFANTDAAFLLQAIENFPGVALLATNLKGNIDPAFFRRLRHVVEFTKPDSALQRSLWSRFVEQLAPERRDALQPSVEALATGIEATGAQIKFAMLSAIFAAQQENATLSGRHLLLGLERELTKEGRSIGPRDRERILKHG